MRSILALVMIAYASASPSSLSAHEAHSGWKYEAYCCNGNEHTGDCQMISTKNVRITPNGYEISLRAGEHRLVTKSHAFRVPQSEARRSQDEEYHLCLYPNEDTLRCFYAPDMSY
ncbi:hypothetical protein [Affinirhizobium pseudoryzae]|jgi:hypothetical protein|uniref:hypothetical protein n=1 Tax=Allorhizobium pseudoryzae TaxID=379684 RepID=UPI0013ED1EEB|nr:hypothetical protein [Allorhizobium pseudoryzae]